MKSNNVMGLVFANVHDDLVRDLTAVRSTASIPFGGRYRLIDFSLSNLVNAGISAVGVIPKFNYHSLMDHLGSGKGWDLDRKSGGLYILPPYTTSNNSNDTGHVQSLSEIIPFLNGRKEKYVVMCDADVVSNINISEMLEKHFENNSDITIAYKNGPLPKSKSDIMSFEFGENDKISKIKMSENYGETLDYSLDVVILERNLLTKLVKSAREDNLSRLWRDVFLPNINTYNFYGYKVNDFAFVIDSTTSYAEANFSLLNYETRNNLFNPNRPVYTKVSDNAPTKYGLNSKVENSLIASGCVIEGTVKNCILFRGVKVMKGAVLENCIIMQSTVIENNANLSYVIADKNAVISENRKLCGAPTNYVVVDKSAKV